MSQSDSTTKKALVKFEESIRATTDSAASAFKKELTLALDNAERVQANLVALPGEAGVVTEVNAPRLSPLLVSGVVSGVVLALIALGLLNHVYIRLMGNLKKTDSLVARQGRKLESLEQGLPPKAAVQALPYDPDFVALCNKVAALGEQIASTRKSLDAIQLAKSQVLRTPSVQEWVPPVRPSAVKTRIDLLDGGVVQVSTAVTPTAFAEVGPSGSDAEIVLNPERMIEAPDLRVLKQFFDFPDLGATATYYETVRKALIGYSGGAYQGVLRKGQAEPRR